MILSDGIVEIILLASGTKRNADFGCAGVDGVELGVEANLLAGLVQPDLEDLSMPVKHRPSRLCSPGSSAISYRSRSTPGILP